MIGSYSPWFVEELRRRVLAEKIEKAMDLAGGAASDFADYRYGCGFLFGMDAVLEMADDIVREVDKA